MRIEGGTTESWQAGSGPGSTHAQDAQALQRAFEQVFEQALWQDRERQRAAASGADDRGTGAMPQHQPFAMSVPAATAPETGATPPSLPPTVLERPHWPPFAWHASVQGQQVQAALRDARLGEHDIENLRRALERRLGAAGLELTELRVNGQPATSNHHQQER